MNDIQEFYIEQIMTTKKIIETFSHTSEFSPTMLINSLLSLVVLPFERAKKKGGGRIFKGKYDIEIVKKLGILPTVFKPINSCNGEKVDIGNKTIYSFIKKFRNGIAHQNLSVLISEDKVIHITIYNKFGYNQCKSCRNRVCKEKGLNFSGDGVIDFEITITVPKLQKLALYIADSYLKAVGGEE